MNELDGREGDVRDVSPGTDGRRQLTRVIGIGCELRGDDQAGLLVARRLRPLVPEGVEVVESDGRTAVLLELLRDMERAFLVDAADDDHPAGTVRRLGWTALPHTHTSTSHRASLGESLQLAGMVGLLPPRIGVYVISGRHFGPGNGMSPAVLIGVDTAVRRLLTELGTGARS